MINVFKRLKEKKELKSIKNNKTCNDYITRFSAAINEANSYTIDKDSFVDISLSDRWNFKYASLLEILDKKTIRSLRKADNYSQLLQNISAVKNITIDLRKKLEQHNELVANNRVNKTYMTIGKVENQSLDKQQLLAICQEGHNHLIIAGAGTGKTTTVVGKVKYLLKSQKYSPKDILVLSFTDASASEMHDRIVKESECKITATTFHKLGMGIITSVEGVKPKVSTINQRTFIKEKLQEFMNDSIYMNALTSYLYYNRVPSKSAFDFNSKKEYDEYLQLNPPVTVQNEQVKSYGEMDIANFLFQNGVRYEYEANYKVDTRTSEYGQYLPDFYLPDYDIYIEYFGINRAGNVPDWFSSRHGKSASEEYRESIQWKRQLHKENNTTLIECFSYEKLEGTLLDKLRSSLLSKNVKLSPMTAQEMWNVVSNGEKSILDGIVELFETVINLIKSNNYTIYDFKLVVSSLPCSIRYLNFIYLIEPIFCAYEERLKTNKEIDFNDMINIATQYVNEGKFINPFSFVIIDEYQDISKARFSLLAALRKSCDFDLFCVGDDWQSIYRFAGSDIGYILNFERFWGPTTISKIETTYRFTNSLIDISGTFIMNNPNQIRKQLRGNSTDYRFSMGEICGYNEKYAIEFLAAKVEDLPKGASVFFIGRYSFDIDLLKDSGLFSCQYNNVSGLIDVKYGKRYDLKMSFLTAHKSKGLQADYVFIINNKSSRMGFPSRIQDDPIIDLLLENSDNYPFAEERRLYYVALTRAKIKTYIMTIKDKKSIFAQELHERYEHQLKKEQFECPLCGGELVRKKGPYGDFFGCENYNTTGCKYTRKIKPIKS